MLKLESEKRSRLVENVCDCIHKNLPKKYRNAFYTVVEENYADYSLYMLKYVVGVRIKTPTNKITEQVISDLAKQFLTHIIEKVKEEYRNQLTLKLAGVE